MMYLWQYRPTIGHLDKNVDVKSVIFHRSIKILPTSKLSELLAYESDPNRVPWD